MSRRTRYTSRTRKADEEFLTALRLGASVSRAAAAAGYTRRSCYRWREADPELALAWDDAEASGTDKLEDEAFRRAHDGFKRPVFHGGEQCGDVPHYSDALLMFLLKSRRPDKYKERTAHEHTGRDGAPINVALTDHDRVKAIEALFARVRRARAETE